MLHIPKHWPTEYSFQACFTCEFCGQKAKLKKSSSIYNSSSILVLYYTILFYIMFLKDNPALKRWALNVCSKEVGTAVTHIKKNKNRKACARLSISANYSLSH